MSGDFEKQIYEKRKGKAASANKSWETTKGEKTAVIIITTVLLILGTAAFAIWILPIEIPMSVKILITVLSTVIWFATIAIFVLIVLLGHNKQDPMEMHYYDVDYEVNHITGKGYDNTKEITKEEFFSKKDK